MTWHIKMYMFQLMELYTTVCRTYSLLFFFLGTKNTRCKLFIKIIWWLNFLRSFSELIHLLYQMASITVLMFFSFCFQKLRNTVKSDLIERCPKCSLKECDCLPTPEENQPMLVFQGPDFQNPNVITNIIPYTLTQVSTGPTPALSRAQTDTNLNGHIQNGSNNVEDGNRTLPR